MSSERGMDIHWGDGDGGGGGGPSIGAIAAVIGIAFGITLAIMLVKSMSTDALAIVIGVTLGIAASIPALVILFIVILANMRNRRADDVEPMGQQRGYPPVVVIQGGAAPQQLQPPGYWPAPTVQSPEYDTVVPGYRVLGQE